MARTRRAAAADPKHDTTDSRKQLKNTRPARGHACEENGKSWLFSPIASKQAFRVCFAKFRVCI